MGTGVVSRLLDTQLLLVSRSRMSGAIPLLPLPRGNLWPIIFSWNILALKKFYK